MHDAPMFTSEYEPPQARHLTRLWVADLLDVATAVLVGWGALRALEVERTALALAGAGAVAWGVTSALGGLAGWTLWRSVLGVRLVAEEETSPGMARGLLRALTVLVELVVTPLLQRRPFDGMLRVYGEVVGRRGGTLAWQLPWAGVVAAAVYFLVMPTRAESFRYLRTLTGWKCCHASKPPTWACTVSVARAAREARRGDAQAESLVDDCPRATARKGP